MTIRFSTGARKMRHFTPFIRRCLRELVQPLPTSVVVSFVSFDNPEQHGAVLLGKSDPNRIHVQLLANGSPYSWAKALAHEATHIEQVHQSRLQMVNDRVVRFDGKLYRLHDHSSHWFEKESPWEREAYTNQEARFKALCLALSDEVFDMGGIPFTLND